jgi:hypothetical protein
MVLRQRNEKAAMKCLFSCRGVENGQREVEFRFGGFHLFGCSVFICLVLLTAKIGNQINLNTSWNAGAMKSGGAHAAGVQFPAARRKSRPTHFCARAGRGKCGTMVWAGRPNQHASRVRSQIRWILDNLLK